jgi:hypothetical protein
MSSAFHRLLRREIALVILAFIMIPFRGTAQIDHYWSQNFNTASALLSGAVVGGEAEISSVFYNPAQISHKNAQNFALTASLFKYERYRLRNGLGDEIDLKRDIFKVLPKFVSYTKSKDNGLDYELAIFTRNEQKVELFADVSRVLDILSQPDGEEFYNADIQYKVDFKDFWIAGGFSKELASGLKIGLGNYISIKTLKNEYELNARAFPQDDTIQINGSPAPFYLAATSNRAIQKLVDVRLLWKFGLQYNKGLWGVGLTVSTPSIPIYGEGEAKRETSRANIFNPSDGSPVIDFSVSDYQRKVRARLKDPLAIALGLHYRSPDDKNSILFTAEYFFPIKEYDMLELEQDNNQATPSVQDSLGMSVIPFKRKTNGVLNAGFGYRKYINEKVSFLGGFRTDFTAADQEFLRESNFLLNRIPYDQLHLTAGGAFVIQNKIEVIGGFQLSAGKLKEVDQMANLGEPLEYIPETGQSLQGIIQPVMDVNYYALSLFFGFTYDFFQQE